MKRFLRPVLVAVTLIAVAACGKKPAPTPAPEPPAAAAEAPASAAASETGMAAGGVGGRRQGGGDPEDRAKQRLTEMQSSLGLSADQTQKIAAVFESQRPAAEALRVDQSLSRDQRRDRMQEMRKAVEPQIAAILTPEQMAKWLEERKQRMERMSGRPGGQDRPAAAPSPTN